MLQSREGADIYKIHVKSKKSTRLTQQVYTPNTGDTRTATHAVEL